SGILLHVEIESALVAQLPFYGLDDAVIAQYRIPLQPETAMEEIWREDDYWYTNDTSTDKVIYGAGLAELASVAGVKKTLLAVMASGGKRLGVVQVSNKLDGA